MKRSFYDRATLEVARDLLGQRLVKVEEKLRLSGIVVETEAYIGTEDLGCHARVGRTPRNQAMFGKPGHAYVYFTYGMHWMLNIVTEKDGFPAAVLLRAVLPEEGCQEMIRRRDGKTRLVDGPAKLCQALGIDRGFDGMDLCSDDSSLFLEAAQPVPEERVERTSRIGLFTVPEPWKSIPWRFRVLSPPKSIRGSQTGSPSNP